MSQESAHERQFELIDSRLLGERIVVCLDRHDLVAARDAHPDLAVYFPAELDELARIREQIAATGSESWIALLLAVHRAKKILGCWLVPDKCPSPLTNPLTSTNK